MFDLSDLIQEQRLLEVECRGCPRCQDWITQGLSSHCPTHDDKTNRLSMQIAALKARTGKEVENEADR